MLLEFHIFVATLCQKQFYGRFLLFIFLWGVGGGRAGAGGERSFCKYVNSNLLSQVDHSSIHLNTSEVNGHFDERWLVSLDMVTNIPSSSFCFEEMKLHKINWTNFEIYALSSKVVLGACLTAFFVYDYNLNS